MLTYIKACYERWSNWSGDSELENAIRRHLTINGHYGGSAKLQNVKLAAVQRPGWLQVYRFDALARVAATVDNDVLNDDDTPTPPAEYQQLYGLVREDVRHNQTTIRTFADAAMRRQLFAEWSGDLIQLRGGKFLS